MVTKIQISDVDYINFLTAIPNSASCVKAADCYSDSGMVVSHDSVNRFLTRQLLHPDALWNEVKPFIEKRNGWLILDDTVIDKIYSEHIEMTQYQWSGKFHEVVKGIGLVTLVWTDGTNTFPVDYRIYDKKVDGLSKNEHFRAMLQTAVTRNFQPYFVLFDSWYSSNDNLTFIDKFGWNWCTRAKQNRMVNPDHDGNQPIPSVFLPDDGRVVQMKKYGLVRLGHSTNKNGEDRYWITNYLKMDDVDRRNLQAICWAIENYHRALKGLCCVRDCKIRKAAGQRNHINCSIRAFVRFEVVKLRENITLYDAKWQISKPAIIEYLKHPIYAL